MWFVGTGARTRAMASARMRAMAAMTAMTVAAASGALLLPGMARADSAPVPVTATYLVTVAADGLPTVQINGVVWSQVVVGNTVFVGGSFTRARPAGAAPGTSETVRNNLLSYDIRTGALNTSFAPSLNAQALVVAASPDGTRLYVGGDFTRPTGRPATGSRLRHPHRRAGRELPPQRQQPGARRRRHRTTPSTWAAASPPSAG